MSLERTIWQYWETKGKKPKFVDDLHDLVRHNSGLDVVLVTPDTLTNYLPDIEKEIFDIEEIAHKADMIRTRLVARYGGMWLDSDAIVIRDISWIVDLTSRYNFVGFNDRGQLRQERPWVRVNCFAAPPRSPIMKKWVDEQTKKLSKGTFSWEEIGTEIIHPLCLEASEQVKILPFEKISPVRWRHVERFGSHWRTPSDIINDVYIVMLSNKSLEDKFPELRGMSIEEIEKANVYLSHFIRRAWNSEYKPPIDWWSIAINVVKMLRHKR